jgi:hypothetical protein
MKLRYLVILGVLVFFNGFIFTVLLLMASRELARPASTPTELSTATATVPQVPSPTTTGAPLPTATDTPAPIATNTMVVVEPTPAQTLPPATATVSTPTATTAPVAPTATAVPATATPSPTPTATATAPWAYEFRYAGGMESEPNCGTVYMKGKITGVGGEGVNGRTVRIRFAGNEAFKVSGEGEGPGEFGFSPLAPENYHSPFTFLIDVVESQANPVPQSDAAEIRFTDCSTAGQFTNIVFAYAK